MIFVDTNILIYSISPDPRDRLKRDRAQEVLAGHERALSVQVLNEFVHQVTRTSRAGHLSHAHAVALTDVWRRFTVVAIDLTVFDQAVAVQRQATLSWWDSLIVAAAVVAGCEALYSEDMQDGRVIDGVRIENPFRELA